MFFFVSVHAVCCFGVCAVAMAVMIAQRDRGSSRVGRPGDLPAAGAEGVCAAVSERVAAVRVCSGVRAELLARFSVELGGSRV